MKFRIKVKRYLKFIFIESRYLWMILAIFSAPFFILAAYQKPLVTCNQIGMSSGCNDAVGVGDVNTNKKERNAAIILVTGLLMWLFLIYDYILKRGWWDKSHIEMVNENNEVKRRI